ncbi:hypothetical protein CLOM_g8139 [Closterium sp. NIES-68]|nr:hypothetical protein CLOM_g8139 [Closterium sp. NIES-68]
MTPRADLLDEVKPPGKIKYVAAASGALLPVIGIGNAKVKGANGELVGLGNVLLVEVKKVQQQQTHGEVLAGVDASAAWAKASSRSGEADWETWHERLCHVNFPMLQKLVKDGSLKGLEVKGGVKEIGSCPTCLETKFSKFPFNSATGPTKTPLALVHMDVVALVKNRVLATVGDKEWIPYVKWYGSAPAVNMLRAFGCMVVFHVPKEKRGKLEASGRWGVHLGIAKDHKGWLLWDLTTQKLTVSRDVKFLESLYYKEWKQQQQKLPSTPLIVEADEVQQPSRQVEVAVSEEEMFGVTKEGGAAEVEQQQQHESPPRVPHPPERPRRDVRPPVRLTYGGRGKPNVVQAGSVVEQIEEDEIAHCYWAPIPEPKTREEALNGPNGEK